MIKKITSLILVLLSVGSSVVFANPDSTTPGDLTPKMVSIEGVPSNCGYEITFKEGYHEKYKRDYYTLLGLNYKVDTKANGGTIIAPGCNNWISKLLSDKQSGPKAICKNDNLSEFPSEDSSTVIDSGVLFILKTSSKYTYDSSNNEYMLSDGTGDFTIANINHSKLTNASDLIDKNWTGVNEFMIDGDNIHLMSGDTIDNVISFGDDSDPDKLLYTEVKTTSTGTNILIKWKRLRKTYDINYKLLNLLNDSDIQDIWKGLKKLSNGAWVIYPYGGHNSTDSNTYNYDLPCDNGKSYCNNNYFKNQFWGGLYWWSSYNQYKGESNFATKLGFVPDGHTEHVASTTAMVVYDPNTNDPSYNPQETIGGKRTDIFYPENIKIGFSNNSGSYDRKDEIGSCSTTINTDASNFQGAVIDTDNLQIKNGVNFYNDGTQFIGYANNNDYIEFNNLKLTTPVKNKGNIIPIDSVQLNIRDENGMDTIGWAKLTTSTNLNWTGGVKNFKFKFQSNTDLELAKFDFKKSGDYKAYLYLYGTMDGTPQLLGVLGNIKIKIIPNNDYKITDVLHTPSIKADGKSSLIFTGKVTDSFGNIINLSKSGLIQGYSIGFIDINETNPTIQEGLLNNFHQFLSTGKFKLSYVAYNKKVVNPISSIVLSIKKRKLDGNLGSVVNVSKSVSSPTTINGIFNVDLLTGANNGNSLPFNTDVRFKLKIKNTGNSDINAMSIRFLPKFTVNGSDYNGVKFVPATGSTILKNMLNGNYSITSLSAGNVKDIYFIGRIEYSGDSDSFNSKIKLGGNILLSYDLDGLSGDKNVKAYYPINSNLDINYRGVYVEGLASNAVKGLYEILRKSKNNYTSTNTVSDLKIKTYNKIVQNANKLIRGIETNKETSLTNIGGIYSNDGEDITLNGGDITKKSLVYVKGADVIIKGNIKKKGGILTIVAVGNKDGEGGHVYIDKNVTNIDAIIVTQNGIYPSLAKNGENLKIGKMLDVVKGNKNSELKNQLLIYGMVISRSNTVGGSIKIDGKYVKPGGKYLPGDTANFYRAAVYDLNYLRRYNINFNPGNASCKVNDPNYNSACSKLDLNRYGTYPVIIKYDPGIQMDKPYGF